MSSAFSGKSTSSLMLRGLVGWLLVTAILALARREIIDSPPYYDAALGLFREADFLAESNFDYRSLTTEEGRFEDGGPAVYIISILPSFVALLMKYSETTRVMLVLYHLFTFACAALVLVLLYALARPHAGRIGAALVAMAVATTPLFAAQIDMAGMEMPLAACAMLTVWAVARERFVLAALASFLAMLMKLAGMVITLALIVYLAMMLAAGRRTMTPARRRGHWLALSVASLVAACEFVLSTWVAELPISARETRPVDLEFGLNQLARCRQWCPDVVGLFLLGVLGYTVLGCFFVVRSIIRNKGKDADDASRSSIESFLAEHKSALFSLIVLAGVLATLSLQYTIPRYLAMPLPFLYLALAPLLFSAAPWHKLACGLLAAVVCFNLANSHGAFYPGITSEHRSGAILERSREYLADHRSNIAAIRKLETKYPDETIVAGTPFSTLLSLPRLGYLKEPAHGYATNIHTTETFKPIYDVLHDKPPRLTFVQVMNAFHRSNLCVLPEMGADDVELYNDRMQSPLIIFRHEIEPAESEEEQRDQYASLLWPNDSDPGVWPESLLISRCEALASAGEVEQAISHLQSAYVRRGRRTPGIVLPLARLMLERDQVGDAEFLYKELLEAAPETAEAHVALGRILVEKGDRKTALTHLAKAAKLMPGDAAVRRRYGKQLYEANRKEEALRELEASLSLDSNDAGTHVHVAQILQASDRDDEAEEHYRRAIDLDADDVAAQSGLGKLLAKSAHPEAAVEFLVNALRLHPDQADVAAALAWIYATHPDASVRNGTEAVILAQQACTSSKFQNAEHLDVLAAALAEQGDFAAALRHAQDAVFLTSAAGQHDHSRAIRRRIELYRSGQPYRESAPAANATENADDSAEPPLSREPSPHE